MVRVAVLDDHQDAAAAMADWSAFPEVRYFREHIADLDALIAALEPYEVAVAMRGLDLDGRPVGAAGPETSVVLDRLCEHYIW